MAENEMIDKKHDYKIQIDRTKYEVEKSVLTGAELRKLPSPDIPTDRDLYQVVPGSDDVKIQMTDKVKMKDGLRFFTAPGHINPGMKG